ncbi:MAG: aminoacyl-tRNA hydrolase [Bacilli bacterium]|nr:aminoacyl-tRNA hydrolase [Bacilli bacterium]
MKLIVGLGNPGREYEKTRHNAGFIMVDALAKEHGISIDKEKFKGLYGEFNHNGEKIMLLKPMKYINLSGEVIRDFIGYFKIDIDDVFIICDDMSFSVGEFKLKYKGSSGGHNGLKNIELHLNTSEYKRMKIGISKDNLIDTRDYVLGKFSVEDMQKLEEIINIFPKIIEDFLELSFNNLMNKYNKKQK